MKIEKVKDTEPVILEVGDVIKGIGGYYLVIQIGSRYGLVSLNNGVVQVVKGSETLLDSLAELSDICCDLEPVTEELRITFTE